MSEREPKKQKQGRLLEAEPLVFAALKESYKRRCGGSPAALEERLTLAFPELCGEGEVAVSQRTIRTFFSKGAASPKTVDTLCHYLLNQSYEEALSSNTHIRPTLLAPPPYWVGRQEHLSRYEQWLQQRSARMLWLWGVGGIGKTTLAEGLAQRVQTRLPHQVLLRMTEPRPVESFLLELLGLLGHPQANRVKDRAQAVLKFFQEYPCLVLVDNLEALTTNLGLETAYKPYQKLLESWIDHDHQSLIVITSQIHPWLQPVSRAHLKMERLSGLPPEDWLPFFQERYRDYQEHPQLEEPSQQEAILKLGRQCEGHPLALHLVSGEILSQMQGDIQAYLRTYGESACHDGLTLFINAQFQRLLQEDPLAWRLLVRMGVYRYSQPVPPAALAALLWDEPLPVRQRVASHAKRLLDRALIQLDNRGGYRLHPLIAQQSKALLVTQAWQTEAHRQAAGYWEGLPLVGSEETLAQVAPWLEAYYHWCTIEDWSAAYQLLNREIDEKPLLRKLLDWTHTQKVLELSQPLVEHLEDPREQLAVYLVQAEAHRKLGALEDALRFGKKSLQLSQTLGYQEEEMDSLYILGTAHLFKSHFAESQRTLFQALALSNELQDQKRKASHLNVLGISYYYLGELDKALNFYQDAYRLYRDLKDDNSLARCLNNLAIVKAGNCDYQNALLDYERALALHRAARDKECEGAVHANIGWLYQRLGAYNQSQQYYQNALMIARDVANQLDEASYLNNLAMTFLEMGELDRALGCCKQGLALVDPKDAPLRLTLGKIHERKGLWREAYGCYQQSLEAFQQNQQEAQIAEVRTRLAQIAQYQQQYALRDEHLAYCLDYFGKQTAMGMDDPGLCLLTCYQLLVAQAKPEEARQFLARAYQEIMVDAERILDAKLKQSFLTAVWANHQIIQLFQAQQKQPALAQS